MFEDNTVISNKLKFKPKDYSYPSYRYNKLTHHGVSGASIILGSQHSSSTFELPVEVYNLSKSILTFNVEFDAPGTADRANWFITDGLSPISQIILTTRGGNKLVDIKEVDIYTKVVTKAETKMEDFLNYPTITAQEVTDLKSCRLLGKSGDFLSALPQDGTDNHLDIIGVTYVSCGKNNEASKYRIQIPLEQIKNTLFELDKDFYANEIINMQIQWNTKNKLGWMTTIAGAALDPSNVAAALPGAVTLSNIHLYLATETNHDIINTIKANVASGTYRLLVPWVDFSSLSYNAAGSQAQQLTYFGGQTGRRLMKIYHTLVQASGDRNKQGVINNKDGAIVSEFYTKLNDNRLQDFNIDCTNLEDYMMLQDKLRGSVLAGADVYQYNWFWLEDFSDYIAPSDLPTSPSKDNLRRGIPMIDQLKWSFYAEVAAGTYVHHTFSVFQRELVVSPNGIEFD